MGTTIANQERQHPGWLVFFGGLPVFGFVFLATSIRLRGDRNPDLRFGNETLNRQVKSMLFIVFPCFPLVFLHVLIFSLFSVGFLCCPMGFPCFPVFLVSPSVFLVFPYLHSFSIGCSACSSFLPCYRWGSLSFSIIVSDSYLEHQKFF